MIPHGVEVFVGLDPIDLRWGFDRLAGLVPERTGREARSGALFVFFGKRRQAMKVLFFDGTGLCILYVDGRLNPSFSDSRGDAITAAGSRSRDPRAAIAPEQSIRLQTTW